MDTSGDNTLSIVLYIVVLAIFIQLAARMLALTWAPRRFPVVAAVATVLIGVPSLLQFVWPGIAAALQRDPAATLAHGQWWRVLTALAAQDGGLVAAIFNLIVVALVVWLAEWIWGRWRTIVLFVFPSLVLNLLAIVWGQPGGGSSFASDGLLMSVAGLALVATRSTLLRVLAALMIVVAIVLVFTADAHGVAMLLGAAGGAALGAPLRRRMLRTRT